MARQSGFVGRVSRAAMLAIAAAGLLVCAARVVVASVWAPAPPSGCAPAPQGLTQQWGTSTNIELFLVGLVFFAMLALLELAPRLAEGPTRATARAAGFLIAVPFAAFVGRPVAAALRSGGTPSLPLSLLLGLALGVLLLAAVGDTTPFRRLPRQIATDLGALARSRWGRAALASMLLVVAFAAGLYGRETWQRRRAAEMARQDLVEQFRSQPTTDSPLLRDPSALVLVKFSDYQCPPCRATFQAYAAVIARYRERYPGRIHYRTMDFPLDAACNDAVGDGIHPLACEAAVAARVARSRGQDAAPLDEWLFAHQAELTRESLWSEFGALAGAPPTAEERRAALAAVRRDVERGVEWGVRSTPTFFIDGRRLEGALPPEALTRLLDAALQETGAASGEAAGSG